MGVLIIDGSKMSFVETFFDLGRKESPAEVHFSMLENGLDFVVSGLRYVSGAKSKSDLKYAVLHLSAGTELVLKERLRRQNWRLLFNTPEKATEQAFRIGDFIGINLETCLSRLEEEGEIDFPNQASLKAFKRLRNRFEHFGVSETREALESSLIQVLGSVLDFVAEAFDPDDLSSREERLLNEIRVGVSEFAKFARVRMAEIAPLLEDWRSGYGHVVCCPCCDQDALRADLEVTCAFCGYRAGAEAAAELHIANTVDGNRYSIEKDGGIYPLHVCPECENRALVYEEFAGEDAICFACGNRFEAGDLDLCDTCGEPCLVENMFASMCGDCWHGYVAADNT